MDIFRSKINNFLILAAALSVGGGFPWATTASAASSPTKSPSVRHRPRTRASRASRSASSLATSASNRSSDVRPWVGAAALLVVVLGLLPSRFLSAATQSVFDLLRM